MSGDALEGQVCKVIRVISGERGRSTLEPGSRLFEEGYIDSFGLLELLTELEKTFNVSFRDEDLTKDTFATVATLCQVIRSKLSEKAP